MSKTLVIRADASFRMGTGHVMRCIALGQAWQDAGGEVSFVFCCRSDAIRKRLASEGFELIELSAAYPQCETDSSIVLKTAQRKGAKWIVVDGYHFDLEYQQILRHARFKLLYIDDYNHLAQYEMDILLNQNIDAQRLDYVCNPECRKMLGTGYVMLRREFRKTINDSISHGNLHTNLLVTMGGSDPDNATLAVVQALEQIDAGELSVKVLLGAANVHAEGLCRALASSSLDCELVYSVQDMPGLIRWADFAITAAGSTCWELSAMSIPFATVTLAENQKRIACRLEQAVGIPSLGWVDGEFIQHCVKRLSSCLSANGMDKLRQRVTSLVDLFGVDRLLQKPAQDYGLDILEDRLVLRPVAESDAELLLEWANDSVTRKNSFNSELISVEDHMGWLADRMGSPRACLFLMALDDVPCGHIRYEMNEEGDAVLSFVVSPSFRGMGIGVKLVELSRKRVSHAWNDCRIVAVALSQNQASAGIFEKTGFIRQEMETIQGKECCLYYWSSRSHER